jgi:cobyrinic acid a,c-diamide synthase
MLLATPRLVLAGLSGDSGKTFVALGLVRGLCDRGLTVAPFKKGPDYIDAAWLSQAAQRPARNLDTYMMPPEALSESLARGLPADVLVVEGNRGLFDGMTPEGTHSTAELAKTMRAPVILVVDVTKSTRTVAAMVLGCQTLDPALCIAGVILNRVATARQENVIRKALAGIGGPPVVGAIPKQETNVLPARHLGLLTAAEHPGRDSAVAGLAETIARSVDLDAILAIARSVEACKLPDRAPMPGAAHAKIAVLRDEALTFYYPENIEALEEAGATLEQVSPLDDASLGDVDAVYVGGGFPEAHAARLADNRALQSSLRAAVSAGTPVYAECGGLMYLAKQLIVNGSTYPMAGVLDVTIEQTPHPVGHGYAEGLIDRSTPFFPAGARLRGHEFHYSHVVDGRDREATALRLDRGTGIKDRRDGISVGRVWASYVHLHALGTPTWAPAVVTLAEARRKERGVSTAACA